jgi:hypothetical protein
LAERIGRRIRQPYLIFGLRRPLGDRCVYRDGMTSRRASAGAENRSGEIRLSNCGTHAKLLTALDNVAVIAPDGQVLFRTLALKIFQHDRILMMGAKAAAPHGRQGAV